MPSAYEVKNNNSLFERPFKIKKNGVFLFGISFFVLEIFELRFCIMQMREVMTFYHFSGKIHEVITSLICIIQKPEYL